MADSTIDVDINITPEAFATAWSDYLVKKITTGPYTVSSSGATRHVGPTQNFVENVLLEVQKQLSQQSVSVMSFGAVADGVTDDSAAFIAAYAYALANGVGVYAPNGTFLLGASVNLRYVSVNMPEATIVMSGSATQLLLGNTSVSGVAPPIAIKSISRSGGATATATCRVVGMKGGYCCIQYCDYLQLYADTDDATTTSIAYNTFVLPRVTELELNTNPSPSGSTTQWINENTFHLSRTDTVTIDGTYAHNHNHFLRGTFESGATINLVTGSDNTFDNVRFEGTAPTITFGSGTRANRILVSWVSSLLPNYRDDTPYAVTDNGVGNCIQRVSRTLQKRIPVLVVNGSTCKTFTDTAGGAVPAQGNFTSIKGLDLQVYGPESFTRDSSKLVYKTKKMPVQKGDGFSFYADVALFRITVQMFDTNGVLITQASDASAGTYIDPISGLSWNSTDSWTTSTNRASSSFVILDDTVAYVTVRISTGGSTSDVEFTRLSLHKISFAQNSDEVDTESWTQQYTTPIVPSVPTLGYTSEVGYAVLGTTGERFYVTAAADTTTTATAVGTDTLITVASATSIADTQVIGVELNDGSWHWTTVNGAPSGTDVTLAVALPSDVAIGNRVVSNGWSSTGKFSKGTGTASVLADDIVIGGTDLANTGMTIQTLNTSAGRIYFQDSGSVSAGGIGYFHSSDRMLFTAGATNVMRIAAAGIYPETTLTSVVGDSTNRWARVVCGGKAGGYRSTTANEAITIATTDCYIEMNSTDAATKAITMTTSGMVAGQRMEFLLSQYSSTGSYTVACTFGVTAGTVTLNGAGEGVEVLFDGSVWKLWQNKGGSFA